VKLTKGQLTDASVIAEACIRNRAFLSGTPAVAYAISIQGTTVLAGARGLSDVASLSPATATTGFRVASITKTFTATLVLQLVERRKVSLDAPVTSYLAWLRSAGVSSEITIRHLLTHSGGVIRDGSFRWREGGFPSREQLHAALSARATFAEPSVGFRYSNMAYALLGEVVEVVGGRKFTTAIDREIVRPLGLKASGTRLTPRLRSTLATGYWRRLPGEDYRSEPATEAGAFEPAGGLISTVGDLLVYQQAHFPGDTRLLSELSKREMQRTQWERSEEPNHGYGWMIWTVDGIKIRGHSGGFPGFTTRIGFSPDHQVAAAVLTNTIGPLSEAGLDVIFHTIARVNALWDDAAATDHGHTRASLGRLTGLYRMDWGDVLVARVNNSLYLVATEDERPLRTSSRLSPVGEEPRFVIVDHADYGNRGEEVVFDVDAGGNGLALHVGGRRMERVAN
jgi:CubicO group peptidase (beta-lactamase class C family)